MHFGIFRAQLLFRTHFRPTSIIHGPKWHTTILISNRYGWFYPQFPKHHTISDSYYLMASVLSIDLWTIWNNFLSFLPTYLRLAPWLSMEVELLDLQLLAVKLVTCPAWRPTEVANHTSKDHKRKSRNEEYLEMEHPETSAATGPVFGCWFRIQLSRYDWWPIGDDCLTLLREPRNENPGFVETSSWTTVGPGNRQGAFGSHPFEIRSSTKIEHKFGSPKNWQLPTIAVCHPPRRSSLCCNEYIAGFVLMKLPRRRKWRNWWLMFIPNCWGCHENAKNNYIFLKAKRHFRKP